MIEAEHTVVINTGIESVWDYVRDMQRWAAIFPGCRECTVANDNDSQWVIKVGVGGLVRTVNVLVHVDQWNGPQRVDFSYKLKSEPVVGNGSYTAIARGPNETEVSLKVFVQGSGQMAPMWEAMCRPLLPQLAKAFSNELKAEIEKIAGVPVTIAKPSMLARIWRWLRNVWRAILGLEQQVENQERGETEMIEKNKQVVLKFIDAMGSSDPETAADCLAADAFTDAKGFCKLSGVRQRDTIVGTIGAFKKLLPTGLRPDVKNVIAERDKVAVEFEGNATTFDGKAYNNQYCMVFTLADGKIKQVNEYFCTKLAEEVLWPSVEAMQEGFPVN